MYISSGIITEDIMWVTVGKEGSLNCFFIGKTQLISDVVRFQALHTEH